jgi:hypothetical protein
MNRLLILLMLLLVVTTEQAQTQTGIAGIWCAASVVPDGTSDGAIRDFFFRTQSERRFRHWNSNRRSDCHP